MVADTMIEPQDSESAPEPERVLGIPEGWSAVPLGTLCSFSNGVNADSSAYGRGVPFVNVLEVIENTHLRASSIKGRVGLSRTAIESFAVRRGDVLFNRTSETQREVGLSAVYDDDVLVVFGGFVIRGRFTSNVIDGAYAGYGFRSPAVRAQIVARGQGAIRSNIAQASLRVVLIPVPPKDEQRAIAQALSDVDRLLRTLDALLDKKRAIRRGTMQQLLTGKTRLPGFSEEWEARELAELGRFLKGRGVNRDSAQSGSLPCVRYGEIYTTHDDVVRMFTSWISTAVALTSTRLERGDILFAGSGETREEIGKCVAFIGDHEAYAGGDIVILRPHSASALFLGYALNMPDIARQKANRGQGDAVVHISARALAQIRLRLPRVKEQAAIAAVLSNMDSEIAALERRRDKTRAIKQGMMQELLTGRVRLVTPEVPAAT